MILPIYAGLERIPARCSRHRADLGGKAADVRPRDAAARLPGVVAGSIFTFSLTLGDYIAPKLVASQQFIGNVVYDNSRSRNLPFAAAFTLVPIVVMVVYLLRGAAAACVRGALMVESRLTRIVLGDWALRVVAVHLSRSLIIRALRVQRVVTQSWPIAGYTTKWFSTAFHDEGVRQALWLSVQARRSARRRSPWCSGRWRLTRGLPLPVLRARRDLVLVVILPLALPGIITGMALRRPTRSSGSTSACWTIIIGHATFCIVVVYNNSLARLRRVSASLEQASNDLGADAWQTFRFVTFPQISTALLAGGLLAFALSWDEVDGDDLHRRRAADTADLDLRKNLFGRSSSPS